MQAAVKRMLQFSSGLQRVPGLMELCGEQENWPACGFRSCWMSFTWFIDQENATVDSRERRLPDGGHWEGQGALLCQSLLDCHNVIMKLWLLPGGKEMAAVLGNLPVERVAFLFQRQQHRPFHVLWWDCESEQFSVYLHSQCFSVLWNPGQVMSTHHMLYQLVERKPYKCLLLRVQKRGLFYPTIYSSGMC